MLYFTKQLITGVIGEDNARRAMSVRLQEVGFPTRHHHHATTQDILTLAVNTNADTKYDHTGLQIVFPDGCRFDMSYNEVESGEDDLIGVCDFFIGLPVTLEALQVSRRLVDGGWVICDRDRHPAKQAVVVRINRETRACALQCELQADDLLTSLAVLFTELPDFDLDVELNVPSHIALGRVLGRQIR